MSDDKKDLNKDLEMLYPDQVVMIQKQQITVREFRYREGIDAAALAGPILVDLRALMVEVGDEISPEALNSLLARHRDIWIELVARSCGRNVEWVAALPDRDGAQLDVAFWGANCDFFMRRLVFGAMLAETIQERRSTSPKSLQS